MTHDRLDLVRCVYYAVHVVAVVPITSTHYYSGGAAVEKAAHENKRGPIPASLPNLSGPRNVWTILDFLTRLN